jgi:flagellar hook-length control protein FliK
METAQIMMMPVTAAAAPAASMCGMGACSEDGFGSLLGQTLALLEQSGVGGAAVDGTLVTAGLQTVQQVLSQEMPEVALALPQVLEDVAGEQEQQPLAEVSGSQERALQLAGFLQAAMLVPTPAPQATQATPALATDVDATSAIASVVPLKTAPEAAMADGADQLLAADEQQPVVTVGQPEQSVRADRPGISSEQPSAAGREVALQRAMVLPQQPAQKVVSVQPAGQAAAEQQVATTVVAEPVVRTDMARAATVAAAAEGRPLVVEVPAAPKGNASNVAQVRFAQPAEQVTATAQPEQQRQQEQGQLGQQQARLVDGNPQGLNIADQPEEATLFQLQTTAGAEAETPHGHSMGVTIQRMAGGQLEVQAAEPAKVAAEAQLMRQVTDRLETHDLKQGTDRISLRLSPEHLGNLQLNLRMEDQQVRVEIVAEHRAVREALLQQVDQLKELLSRQNIKMESFDVTTANNGGLTQQQQGDWRQAASERRPLYAQQYGASRSAGSGIGGTETAVQYFAPQYQSTLDVRF